MNVKLTADGSCFGNRGPGGWACILQFGDGNAYCAKSDSLRITGWN